MICCINFLSLHACVCAMYALHAQASSHHLLIAAECSTHIRRAPVLPLTCTMHGKHATRHFNQAHNLCGTLALKLDCCVHW